MAHQTSSFTTRHYKPGALEGGDEDLQPRRPKASPRLTPSPLSSSGRSTPNPWEVELEPWSELESPIRGRLGSMVGTSFVRDDLPNLIIPSSALPPLAIPRRRAGPSSADVDDHRVSSHRLMSKDLSISPDDLDDPSILESYPTGKVHLNVAEILSDESQSSTLDSLVDWSAFAGHRDTFALRQMRHDNGCPRPLPFTPVPVLPRTFFEHLNRYIDFDTYHSVRLSCRCWSAAISGVRPPRLLTIASSLPVEIVQRVYAYLSPIDFNAARHFCRRWMLASLSQSLLVRMLQRGGWWSAARADEALIEECAPRMLLSGEWLLSKRLSTECSLRPDWTGNGLGGETQDGSTSSLHESSLNSNDRLASESFLLVSEIDFSALSPGGHDVEGGPHAGGSRFTISVCGKYLLVTRDYTIYIYSLNSHASITTCDQSPCPAERLTNLVCPRRVLSVAMDTSCGRFAIAALLHGRAGFVCDLRELGTVSQWQAQDAYLWDPVLSALWDRQDSAAGLRGPYDHGRFPSSVTPGPMEAWFQRNSSNYSTDPLTPPYPSAKQTSMPVVPGLSSVFYNLGTAIDCPVSVAICAQRRCIAFGCSTAVELHWVDALTGHGLNRRFSIPAGGEVLHFFPERQGERKMRVIDTEAVPAVWPTVAKDGPLESGNVGGIPRDDTTSVPEESDYYNAIPLSDGTHVLFANRFSARLCLGIETPPTVTRAIDAGYVRLETRAIFEGPPTDEGSGRAAPRIYDAARDLRWGARVAVGFGDEVWVFAVPGDFLKDTAGEPGSENGEGGEIDDDDNEEQEARTSILRIGGIRVGSVDSLAKVGICADGGGVLVRGVGRAGLFKEWRLTSRPGEVKSWVVRSDGSVLARGDLEDSQSRAVERDADGDVVMKDYIPRDSSSCYDDEAIRAESDHDDDDDDKDEGGGGVAIEFDLDGDVIMRDAGMWHNGGGGSSGGGGDEEVKVDLDEGYFSDDQGLDSGTLTIHPADAGCRGTGERVEIGMRGDSGGMGIGRGTEEDLGELSRVEVEVFGGCKR